MSDHVRKLKMDIVLPARKNSMVSNEATSALEDKKEEVQDETNNQDEQILEESPQTNPFIQSFSAE